MMPLRVVLYSNGEMCADEHCNNVSFSKGEILTLDFIDYKKSFNFGVDFDWFYVSYDE